MPEDDADTGRHHLLIRRNDKTGELAYLRCYSPRPVTVAHPGHRGRTALAHRGILPSRQRPHRAGPAPSPPLDLLAPLDHPGHARPCLPGRGHRNRTRRPPRTGRSDHVDRQRISTPLRRPTTGHPAHRQQPAGLVTMATTTPTPSPSIPLPTTQTDLSDRHHRSRSTDAAYSRPRGTGAAVSFLKQTRPDQILSHVAAVDARALAGVSLRDETLRLDHLTMAVIDEIDMVGTDDLRQLLTVTTHAGSRRCWSMTPTSWPGQGSRTTMRASSVG